MFLYILPFFSVLRPLRFPLVRCHGCTDLMLSVRSKRVLDSTSQFQARDIHLVIDPRDADRTNDDVRVALLKVLVNEADLAPFRLFAISANAFACPSMHSCTRLSIQCTSRIQHVHTTCTTNTAPLAQATRWVSSVLWPRRPKQQQQLPFQPFLQPPGLFHRKSCGLVLIPFWLRSELCPPRPVLRFFHVIVRLAALMY